MKTIQRSFGDGAHHRRHTGKQQHSPCPNGRSGLKIQAGDTIFTAVLEDNSAQTGSLDSLKKALNPIPSFGNRVDIFLCGNSAEGRDDLLHWHKPRDTFRLKN